MKELGIGMVGLGRLGYIHACNVQKAIRARLVAVCDQQEELARNTAGELGCKYYTDIRTMLENKDIDAVCVATPTAIHVEPVTAAVQAGKPIFCEKPLASNLEDTRKLTELIGSAEVKCQVGFQRRFDGPHTEAEKLIREGAIGKPVFINACARDPFPPPPWALDPSKGGGLYVDFLLHDFDMARFLMKDEVDMVYADETNLVVDGQGIERFADNAIVTLRFRGGALATYHTSIHAEYGYDIRTEIHGAKGNILIGGLNSTEVILCSRDCGISRPRTYQTEGRIPHFVARFQEAYKFEIAAFVDCVLDNTAPKVTADDALQAFRIAIAAGDSAGFKRPVSLKDY